MANTHARRRRWSWSTVVASAVGLALLGCEAENAFEPEPMPAPMASSKADAWSMSPLLSFADESQVGTSLINRNSQGFTGMVEHDGLGARSAVTVWAVVFNDPSACAAHPDPCMLADLFDPDVQGDVLRLGGNVVNGSKDKVGGRLREGDTSESIAMMLGLEPVGLLDAMMAEIHFVFRSHGPPIPGMVDDQIHSVGGGCTTALPDGSIPDDVGECADVAFAIHQ